MKLRNVLIVLASVLALGAMGCEGPAGPPGATGADGEDLISSATSVTGAITGVTMGATTTVSFTLLDQDGNGVEGLTDMRATFAKLVPANATTGDSSYWQSYVNRLDGSSIQATYERPSTTSAVVTDLGDGKYTFRAGKNLTAISVANGEVLDVAYEPSLTHRVGMQFSGLPSGVRINLLYDFVPSGGAVAETRDMVAKASCNECHNELRLHGSRIETGYCVTCHNPGTTDDTTGNTVDFRVMVHKIHRGKGLHKPQQATPVPYNVASHQYSELGYPQDIRNCEKCHNAADVVATPDAGDWATTVNKEVCTTCHDNVVFDGTGIAHYNTPGSSGSGVSALWDTHAASDDPAALHDPMNHSGGPDVPGSVLTNTGCVTCHTAGGLGGATAANHVIPDQALSGNFQYNIDPVTAGGGTDGAAALAGNVFTSTSFPFNVAQVGRTLTVSGSVSGNDGIYTIASVTDKDNVVLTEALTADEAALAFTVEGTITVTFSIENPNDGTFYDLDTDGAGADTGNLPFDGTLTGPGGASRLALVIGWDTSDYSHEGASTTGSGKPGQPASINPLSSTSGVVETCPTATTCVYTYTYTLPAAALTAGTGVVAIEGHPAGWDGTGTNIAANYTLRVPVRSAVDYFAITDTTPKVRREAIDITAKCDNCHGSLSMHGNNRTDEGEVCVICHNADATDITRRGALPALTGVDGKLEETIDFKHMIHSIHSAEKRVADANKPITVYGYGGTEHTFDTSAVHFPGVLNDCTACHVSTAFRLPLGKDVQGTTIKSNYLVASPDTVATPGNDLNRSPTAAVCSGCHQGALGLAHMGYNGAVGVATSDASGGVGLTQTQLDAGMAIETCAVCHGPGRGADVDLVHGL